MIKGPSTHKGYSEDNSLMDSFGRRASKLRISVTDRCNFRCDFCMPLNPVWLPHSEILTYEEITRITKILVNLGIRKVRLSGGEPLVRKDLEILVNMLNKIYEIESISMTTNGALLEEKARVLKDNGLKSVTISLHSLKPELYDSITRTKNMFYKVLRGIEEAKRVGLKVKINCVVTRNCNDNEVLDFAKLAYEGNINVRFIEYMPFDGNKLWDIEKVVSGDEILERIKSHYPLVKLPREHGSTAENYAFKDGSKGGIGIISSITKPFCKDCDRIRLKADGKIVPCLFSNDEYDLKPLLRGGASDEEIAQFIKESFWKKSEGVEAMIKKNLVLKHIRSMYTIGG
ncbi:MAG: GTP 3',8-cyclase MoaA [Nitrososphaerales archaeon]